MKIFITFFVLAISVHAYALPALNDYAKFDVVVLEPKVGKEVKFSEEMKLVDYDKPTDVYLLEQKILVGQVVQEENYGIKAEELLTENNLKTVVQMCELGHGLRESVNVKGLMIQSCRFEVKNNEGTGYRWYAVVPFGIVKEEFSLTNGITIKKQMIDYSFGKK